MAVGTWTLTGTTLTCSSKCVYGLSSNIGVSQTFSFQFDKTNGTLSSGVWADVAPTTGSGTFSLTKVN